MDDNIFFQEVIKNVKKILENILENTDEYNIDAYQRKVLTDYPGATKNLAKHSLYVITNKNTNDGNIAVYNIKIE